MPVEYNDTTANVPEAPLGGLVLPDWGTEQETDPTNDTTQDEHGTITRSEALTIYQVALPIIFGLIIALGIIGNVMVIIVITTRRKMRTVTNFLLLNLAITDVAFLVICGPFTMTHYALDKWPLGNAMCQTIQYFLYVTCYVTVYTLVAVAVVRYFLMVRLSTHPGVKDPHHIAFVILGIWAMSLIVNTSVPLSHGATLNPHTNRTECVISCPATGKIFFSFFFVFSFAFPLLVVAILYVLLVQHLRTNHRNSMINKSNGPGKQNGKSSKTGSGQKSSHVTRLLILVVTVFAVCWLPLQVHLMWGTFGHLPHSLAYRMLIIVWHALVFLNSALNPVIYHFFSSEFRGNFKSICRHGIIREQSSGSGSGSSGALMRTSV